MIPFRSLLFMGVLWTAAGTLAAGDVRLSVQYGTAKVQKTRGEGMGGVEAVFAPVWKGIRPLAGCQQSISGDRYAYLGALREWTIGERWVGTFGLGGGHYHYNGGDDLGGPLEFQSRVALDYSWTSGVRTGLVFMHISNSNLYRFNPGSERLLLTLSFPLD